MKQQLRIWIVAVLAAIAVVARLLLQTAALPPYAGLDEAYHVARLAFVAQEHRNPRSGEPSVPPYLVRSIAGDPRVPPAFGVIGPRWPDVLRSRTTPVTVDPPLVASELRPYIYENYEVQQPSLYYSLAAPLHDCGSALAELRAWRLLAALCAFITCAATAVIGYRRAGAAGIVAGVALASLPSWLTLNLRASNDALACALIAVGLALSDAAPRSWKGWLAEALAWSGALATKLYSWPVAALLPLLWWRQRAPRGRWLTTMALSATGLAFTIADLAARTRNPLGLFSFDAQRHAAGTVAVPIDWTSVGKITAITGIWTSGQHWNALRPAAMALYVLPLLLLIAIALLSDWRELRRDLTLALAALAIFGVAQVVELGSYVRAARAAGLALPSGGKEGWYWYCLAPVVAGIILAAAFRSLRPALALCLLFWLLGWDVLIHEGALFQDFAGLTDPLHGDRWVVWGPRLANLIPHASSILHNIATGPLAARLGLLRLVHLACAITAAALAVMGATPREPLEAGK
jgi:hypothetical protein